VRDIAPNPPWPQLRHHRVNSKATLRIHTKDFLSSVPKILHSAIEGSRYYAKNSKSIIIQGDGSRNRTDNAQECYKKLHALIVAIGRSTVRGETSPDRVDKVKVLYVVCWNGNKPD